MDSERYFYLRDFFNSPFGLFRCMGFLAEVELLHAFYLIADGLQIAGAAVRGHAFQNFGQGQGDVLGGFGIGLQGFEIRILRGDENQLYRQHIGIALVAADKGIAHRAEADPLPDGLLADANLLSMGFRRGAHHVSSGEHMILHEVDALNGAEGLLGIVLVIALNVGHLNQGNAGVGGVLPQVAQIPSVNQNFIPGNQSGIRGDAGKADGALSAAAQLKGGIPQHYQLEILGFRPDIAGIIGVTAGLGSAQMLRYGTNDCVEQLHNQNFTSAFLRSKILLT